MDFESVNEMLVTSLEQVVKKDSHLLKYDLNECSITHRLAVYLTPKFEEFDVDCEYNGNVDAHNGRKYISLLTQRASELGLLNSNSADQELVYRTVFPDIIVHKRSKNGPENNLLVIEVKKSSSRENADWDSEKLSRFTSSNFGNTFNYRFGVFVLFQVGDNAGYSVEWYQDGLKNCR